MQLYLPLERNVLVPHWCPLFWPANLTWHFKSLRKPLYCPRCCGSVESVLSQEKVVSENINKLSSLRLFLQATKSANLYKELCQLKHFLKVLTVQRLFPSVACSNHQPASTAGISCIATKKCCSKSRCNLFAKWPAIIHSLWVNTLIMGHSALLT